MNCYLLCNNYACTLTAINSFMVVYCITQSFVFAHGTVIFSENELHILKFICFQIISFFSTWPYMQILYILNLQWMSQWQRPHSKQIARVVIL